MYTNQQKEILDHTITKVQNLFEKYPSKGHNFDHAEATAKWAKEVAIGENAQSVFLCELAGYLHDVGRAAESHDLGYTIESGEKAHHELSYLMLLDWFKNDKMLQQLSPEQKTEILYAIRNHWNNVADKYDTAWILRDADKLDLFGERGITRNEESHGDNQAHLNRAFRYIYDCYYWMKTATARRIIEEQRLMEPIDAYYKNFLKDRIKDVT